MALHPTSALKAQSVPPPTDFSDIETFLTQAETERRGGLMGQINGLTSRLNAILANDTTLLNAYKDVYSDVNFEGAKKEHASVKAWEEKNKALFHDPDFLWALRAHVRYLLITLTKRAGEDAAAVQQTIEWIQSFPKTPEKFQKAAASEILRNDIAGSAFLRSDNSTALLQGIPNWQTRDLANLPELHRINVLGWLRAKKDPQLFTQWEMNIALEQEAAERDGLAAKRQHFLTHRRPWLLWQVGKDYAAFGQRRQAVEVMVRALKESPRCEDYDRIVAEIRKIIAEARGTAP